MKVTPVSKKKVDFNRPYLVKVDESYFVSYLCYDDSRYYFDDVKRKQIIYLEDVDELARIDD